MEMSDEEKAAAEAAAKDAAEAAAAAEAEKAKGGGGGVVFSPEQQAHIDGLISKAHGKAKTQTEAEFKKWLDQQAMTESDRLKAEKVDAEKAVADAKAEVLATRVEAAAGRAAVAAGVNAAKVDRFMRLVDLDVEALTADGKPDADAIKAHVAKVVEEWPEFKASGAGNGQGGNGSSGGEFNGGGGGKVWTKAEIAKLSTEEYEKHEDEILKQLATTGVK